MHCGGREYANCQLITYCSVVIWAPIGFTGFTSRHCTATCFCSHIKALGSTDRSSVWKDWGCPFLSSLISLLVLTSPGDITLRSMSPTSSLKHTLNENRDWDEATINNADPSGVDGGTSRKDKPIEQVGKSPSYIERQEDEFMEGGFEGWKVVLGCALIAGPSIGMLFCMPLYS